MNNKITKLIWNITPYTIDVLNFNFGFEGDYEISVVEILTRRQEDNYKESTSLLSIKLHRMFQNKRLTIYLWSISILFINIDIIKRIF